MLKNYLLRIILLCFFICRFVNNASAQYAVGGTAGANLYNSVYWLTWDKTATGSTLITAPAGADALHIVNGTYVWQFSPTVQITAVISNETFVGGASQNMVAYTPGDYQGDGLDLIYSGNNLPKVAGSRGVQSSGLSTTNGGQVTFNINITVAIKINGAFTNVAYPGMVIADAESIDSGGEFISGDTPNPIAWQLINKRTEGNAADQHYKMDLTNGGRSFKLYADLPPGNFGVQAVMFAHGATGINNVSMKGSGITAMAIGFVLPFDLGDDPQTYGTPGHYMDQFQITDYYPGDGTYAVVTYNTTPLLAKSLVYMGADTEDPDGQPAPGVLANSDDLTGNNDENSINLATFPVIKVNQAGNVVLNIPCTNLKAAPATLYAWIDFNNDGAFTIDELLTAVVPANTNNQQFTLTFLNPTFSSKLKTGTLYCRLRLTTTLLLDDAATTNTDERSVSFAADGEAEDYKLPDIVGVTISGTVLDDHDGLNGSAAGVPIQTVSGQQLYAYLIDNTNTVINKATVAANGTYSFVNTNNGNYTVAISTNSVAAGVNISAVAPNLPTGWVPSGEAYGTNNAGHTGIEPGTPNLQIAVSTPGTSLDVTGVNFALNQAPVAVDDPGTVIALGGSANINVLANDGDPDNPSLTPVPNLNVATVLLIDPADNVKKTTVTLPGKGTFTVNTGTGVVSFTAVATPLPAFAGKAIVSYTVKDDYNTESNAAVITVSVKPAGTADAATTTAGTATNINVKTNDASGNLPGILVTLSAAASTGGGTVTVNSSGVITYTPAPGFSGADTFTYTLVTADGVVSDPITVTVQVGPTSTPFGSPDVDFTTINSPVVTVVTANDISYVSGTSVIAISAPPAHGTAVVTNSATGAITYTPATNYIGKDTYTYTITNGANVSAPITVTINVKPVGQPDVDVTTIATPKVTTVKTNDGAVSGGPTTTVTVAATPGHGTAVVANATTGTVTYTPTGNYIGKDFYTYTLTTADGVVSDQIRVDISIKPVGVTDNDIANINTAVTTDVRANDGASGTGTTVTNVTTPAHGTVVLNPSGTVTYTPANNYIGKDSYTYTLTTADGVVSDPITVNISVRPVGANDADITLVNVPVTTNVKANDGASATGTTVNIATPPAHGTAVVVNATTGTVTYTPAPGYTGVDTYTYTLTTADGVVSAPITVNIGVGTKPIGLADADVTTINIPVITTVTANDPSAANSTTTLASPPAHGTAVVTNAATGKITYTPAPNYIGKDTYTYTLTVAGVTSDPITVTISVAPVGTPDNDTTPLNTAVTTTVKANDGASATGTTVAIAAVPTHGTALVNPSGTVTYTPVTGYTGTDTYTYTLTTADGVVSAPILVTITVGGKPIGVNDVDSTPINTFVNTTVTTNDPGAPGSTVAVLTQPAHGAATLVSATAGIINYVPATNFTGKDSYTYTLTKGGIVSDPITVTISVKPVGVDDTDLTPVNTAVVSQVKNNDGASATGTTIAAGSLAPAHGTISINPLGQVTYTPVAGYVGTDKYTYTLNTADGVVSDPITVTITIYTTSMTLTKVANNGASKAGDVINYTLVVTNTGTVALTNVVVADAGADAGSISPATIATLAVGASATVTAKHTTTAANVTTGQYSNQASATATDPKGNTVSKPKSDNPATAAVDDPTVVTILVPGSVSLVKTGVLLSNVITYTFTIKNTGTTPLTSITLTDAKVGLNNIPIAVTGVSLAAGASIDYYYVYTLAAADRDLGMVSNTATVNAKDISVNTVTATSSVMTTVPKSPTATDDVAQVSVNKSVIIRILNNDNTGSGISLNPGTVEIMTQPAHGTLVINTDGTVTYTPNPGYVGPDSFTYRVKDIFGYYTNIAKVSLVDLYEGQLKIPTLFTPNGDGVNDTFEIRDIGLFAQNELVIVNRWGNEVFKQNGYKNTWTGDGLNEGTYYYVLKVKTTDDADWQVYKGYVMLIRVMKK